MSAIDPTSGPSYHPLGQTQSSGPSWWNELTDHVYGPLCIVDASVVSRGEFPLDYFSRRNPFWDAISSYKAGLQNALNASGLTPNEKTDIENAQAALNALQTTTSDMTVQQKQDIISSNVQNIDTALSALNPVALEHSLSSQARAERAVQYLYLQVTGQQPATPAVIIAAFQNYIHSGNAPAALVPGLQQAISYLQQSDLRDAWFALAGPMPDNGQMSYMAAFPNLFFIPAPD